MQEDAPETTGNASDDNADSTTAPSTEDPPLDDPDEEEDTSLPEQKYGLRGMAFWNEIQFDTLVHMAAPTTAIVPKQVKHAIACLKEKLAEGINQASLANDKPGEIQAWKALFALDAILFWDIGEKGRQRHVIIADRISMIEEGYWAPLWASLAPQEPRVSSQKDADEMCAKRIEALMTLGEASRAAAAAVWGSSGMATAKAVKEKFLHTQRDEQGEKQVREHPNPRAGKKYSK